MLLTALIRHRKPRLARFRRRPQRARLLLEVLEDRTLPSISLSGVPSWVEQGPGPIQPPLFLPVAGAINAIAADPTDANRVFAATVNGGVWRTDDATDSNPFWTPLTDQFPSLSMGAIAFSPLDPTRNTLFAGIGHFSSGAGDGGPLTGLLRTTDGGNTWRMLGQDTFSGRNIQSVVPTSIAPDGTLNTQVVLVGTTDGGLFRSTNGGSSWVQTSGASNPDGSLKYGLPAGGVTDVVPDQSLSDRLVGLGNPNRFYAAVPGTGGVVFRSDDAGASWRAVHFWDLTDANGNSIPATRIRLSVHNIPGDSTGSTAVVWEGVVTGNFPSAHLSAFYRSADGGDSWDAMSLPGDLFGGLNPAGSADTKFSIAADRNDPNVVFVGGDADPVIGFAARIMRGDFGFNHWQDVYAYPPLSLSYNGTPHSDSRNMVFDANGNVLECDDGGIYRLSGPDNFLGLGSSWSSVNGNIRPTEFYSVAYDSLDNLIFGGTQDNGSPANLPDPTGAWHWPSVFSGGDGGIAQYETQSFLSLPVPVWYTSTDSFGAVVRYVAGIPTPVFLNVTGSGKNLSDFENSLPVGRTIQFIQPYVLDAAATGRMLIGTNNLYESLDGGNDLTFLGNVGTVNPFNATGREGNPMAYGGFFGLVANPEVIWVGAGGGVRLRTHGSGLPGPLDKQDQNKYPGGIVQAIGLDPIDWHSAFVVDIAGCIWHGVTDDSGNSVTWTNLTGNLNRFTTDLRAIAVLRIGSKLVLTVGGQGGVYRTIDLGDASPTWSKFGINLPNAPVTDLHYDVTNDVLLAGTLGRGAWTVPNASATILRPGILQIDGDTDFENENDSTRLIRDANNPLLLDVFLNNSSLTANLSVPFATIQQIDISGFGGNNTLTLDLRNGNVIPEPLITAAGTFSSLTFNGGNGLNTLDVYDKADPNNPSTWTMTDSKLTRSGPFVPLGIDYRNVATMALSGGATGTGSFNGSFAGNLRMNLAISGFGAAALDVQGDLSGSFLAPTVGTVSAPIDHVTIRSSMLAGSRIKVNYLNSLSVTGDLAGTVDGYGNSGSPSLPTIGPVTIGGNFTGTITAPVIQSINMQPTSNFAGYASETMPGADFQSLVLGTVTSTGIINTGSIVNALVAGDMAGQITVSGTLSTLSIGGTLSGSVSATTIGTLTVGQNLSGSVFAASIGSLTVGQDLAGQVVVSGPLGTLSVTGNLSGSVSATTIDTLDVGQNLTGTVTASQSIGTLLVGGDITGTVSTPVIASATINGTMHDDTFVITPTSVVLNGRTVLSGTFQSLTVNGRAGNDLFTVSGGTVPATLNGGDGADTFRFTTGAAITGRLDGQGGTNTLDYTSYTGDVVVDLPLGTATAVGGGVANIQNVSGSIGNDLLVGDAFANVLIGGTGRNILIGGLGADEIVGGGGDNILIGGTTAYDTNSVALAAIMAEWTRTDLSFQQRLADLISDASPARALNGTYHLNKKTVFDDGGPDVLTGGGGLDWFFADLAQDQIENRKAGDHITGF
jgi:hypothetical protein